VSLTTDLFGQISRRRDSATPGLLAMLGFCELVNTLIDDFGGAPGALGRFE
jgi:hypothetical protein